MTNTQTPPLLRPGLDDGTSESRLRTILRANAISCVLTAVVVVAASATIDDLLGTDHVGWVRVVGFALVPFAAVCWWTAAGSTQRLRSVTPFIVAGDTVGVITAVCTAIAGWYSGGGTVLVLATAALIDTFVVFQWLGWRKLDRDDSRGRR